MKSVVVQLRDQTWTLEAMHLACAVARSHSGIIHLLRMMPVQHTSWLGNEWGTSSLSSHARLDLLEYQKTAEDYGVEVCLCQMQYFSLYDALAEASEALDAGVLFATLPPTLFRPWRKIRLWQLVRRLERQKCRLFTLDPEIDVQNHVVSITLPPLDEIGDEISVHPPVGTRYQLSHSQHNSSNSQ